MKKYDFMVIKHRNNGLWPIEVEKPLEIFDKYGDDVASYELFQLNMNREVWGFDMYFSEITLEEYPLFRKKKVGRI